MGYKDKQIADALRVAKRARKEPEPAPYFDPNAPTRLRKGVLNPNITPPDYGAEVKRWRGERGALGREGSYDPWSDPENIYTHPTEERHAPDDPKYHVSPEEFKRGALGREVFALKDGGRAEIENALRLAFGGRARMATGGNPNDAYLNSLYQNLMGRQADPEGFGYWQKKLNEGSIEQPDVLHAFAQSPEFQGLYKTDPSRAVSALYQTALGRAPDQEGLNAWTQQAKQGLDLGQLVSGFTGSEEGGNVQDINQLYQYYTGSMPTTEQLREGVSALFSSDPITQYLNKTFPTYTTPEGLPQEARNRPTGEVMSDAVSAFGHSAATGIRDYAGKMGNYNPNNSWIGRTNWGNAEILKNTLQNLGVPDQGVYSILGNFIVESNGLRPGQVEVVSNKPLRNKKAEQFRQERKNLYNVLNSDDWKNVDLNQLRTHKLGLGLAQWTADRAVNLINFAKEQGKDWRDMQLQSDFLAKEIKERPELLQYYRDNPNAGKEGVAVFERVFENPRHSAGRASADDRYDMAVAASQYFDDPQSFGNFGVSPLVVAAKENASGVQQAGAGEGVNLPATADITPTPAPTPTPTPTPTPAPPPGMDEYEKAMADYRQAHANWAAQVNNWRFMDAVINNGRPSGQVPAPLLAAEPRPPNPANYGSPSGGTYAPTPPAPAPSLQPINQGAGTTVPGGSMINPGGGPIGPAPAPAPAPVPGPTGSTWTPQPAGQGAVDHFAAMQNIIQGNRLADQFSGVSGSGAGPGMAAPSGLPSLGMGVGPTGPGFGVSFMNKGGSVDPHVADALRIARKSGGGAWTRKEGKSESGGLNEKGRASLRAQGHDIKRPQPEGGPRRDSFCARMKGMKAKLTSSETANDPDSRINKSLRKWNCADGGAIEDALRLAKGGDVWDKPRPKSLGKPDPLSKSQKRSAKAAAKAAERPYPNLVDNLRAAQRKK